MIEIKKADEKRLLDKEVKDFLKQIREKNPQARIEDGILVDADVSPEVLEEIEKKAARLKELEAQQ